MKQLSICLGVLGLLALPVFADGPETGIVQGSVSDAEGTALPGVLLTLTGDRGSQNVVSEADGSYRFALLVPGNYTVKAELEGFTGGESAVTVSAGGKHSADIELKLGTTEEITVTSEAPMVDKFNVTAGSTVSAEVGEQTAGTTRTYYGVINALPGVTADAQNDDIQQTRPSVNGTHFADNNVFIDGVDTTFAKFGGSRVFLPTTAITEVSMEAGGSSAEYGRAIGSSTNVIVKSGTNRFHIDGLFQRQEVKWGSDYEAQPSLSNREVQPFPNDWFQRCYGDSRDGDRLNTQCLPGGNEWEGGSNGYEFSAGGPLKRDRAWFFVGASDFDDAFQERLLGGDPYDVSLLNEAYIFKFNFQPATAHSISASIVDTPAFRNYFNQQSFDYWTPTPHSNDSELFTVNYNNSISSKLFLETKVALQETQENKFLACDSIIPEECIDLKARDAGPLAGHTATDTSAPSDLPLRFPRDPSRGRHFPGNNYDVYTDSNLLGAWHNGWILSDGFGFNAFPREQANAGLTQFIGANHEIKYGIDYQTTKWEGQAQRTSFLSGYNYDSYNDFGYQGAGTVGDDTCSLLRTSASDIPGRSCAFVDYNAQVLQDIRGSGDAEMRDTAFFVRDRFTVGDHWTFNLGIRAELQEGFNDVRRQVVDATYADPRINMTYDLNGDGKMLFSLNAGRYHAMLNQAWIAGGGDVAGGMHDMWNGYEGYEVFLFCDVDDVGLFNAIGVGVCDGNDHDSANGLNSIGFTFPWSRLVPGRMWEPIELGIFEHSIDPYFKEEIIVGWEWQLARNWAMDVKYIDWRLEDMMFSNTQLDHRGRNIFLTGNYKNLPSIISALEQARQANGFAERIPQENIDSFKQARNSYKGLQLQVNRRMANNFAVYNNISWSETDTTGAGAWWNNTNSSYGENFDTVLTRDHIEQCDADQVDRTVPVSCQEVLSGHVGEIASTIFRRGANHAYDRAIIFNSFGFKNFFFGANGRQSLTVGGHLTYQTGTPWQRSEGVSTFNLDPATADGDPFPGTPNDGIELRLNRSGDSGYRTNDEHTLNLSGAYGFPMGANRVRGELRVEVLNVSDEQKRRDWDGRGEVYPVRRFFQRPRQARVNFKVSW